MEKTTEQLKQLQPVVMKQLQIIERKNRIGQAYIFEGKKGTATEEVAHFFVKLLLCEQPIDGEPCNICRSCQRKQNMVANSKHFSRLDSSKNIQLFVFSFV